MSTSHQAPEKLKLTFVTQAAEAPRTAGKNAWPLWIAMGAVMGLSIWFLGKHVLKDQLGREIATAENQDDALLALAGLASLGDDALEPIVNALAHRDAQVAQAAFRVLDQRVSAWQAAPEEAVDQFLGLAKLLDKLPEHTLPERLTLASALSTRIVAYTAASEINEFKQASDLALGVISRAADAQFQPTEELIAANQPALGGGVLSAKPAMESSVPPPLPPGPVGNPGAVVSMRIGDSSPSLDAEFTDSESTPTLASKTGQVGDSDPRASFQLVPRSQLASGVGVAAAPVANGSRIVEETAASYAGTANSAIDAGWSQPENMRAQSSPIRRVVNANQVDLAAIPSFDIDQLVRLLGSTQPQVAQTAALALRDQGMSSDRLALASQFAVGASEEKLELMHRVVAATDVEPRPWLLWMAEDRDPLVRRQAVSLLHSLIDDRTGTELRKLLLVESDPAVAATIRKVLAQNPGLPLR